MHLLDTKLGDLFVALLVNQENPRTSLVERLICTGIDVGEEECKPVGPDQTWAGAAEV